MFRRRLAIGCVSEFRLLMVALGNSRDGTSDGRGPRAEFNDRDRRHSSVCAGTSRATLFRHGKCGCGAVLPLISEHPWVHEHRAEILTIRDATRIPFSVSAGLLNGYSGLAVGGMGMDDVRGEFEGEGYSTAQLRSGVLHQNGEEAPPSTQQVRLAPRDL